MTEINHLSVEELNEKITKGSSPIVVDVRENEELAQAPFSHEVVHIPLGHLPDRLNEFDKDEEIVFMCHLGGRSLQATQFFQENGFKNVSNLRGGIDAWSKNVDASIPRY
jgi:adenylyltransferase/sulfurtransferase